MSSALSCTKCAFAHQSRSLIPSLLSLPLSSFSLYAEFSLSRCQARCLTPILLSHTDHALTYRSRSLMLILHSLILTALFDIMRFLISSSIQEHSLIKSALSHTTLSYSLIPSTLSHTTTSYQVHSLIQLCQTHSYQVHSLIQLSHTKHYLSYHSLSLSHTKCTLSYKAHSLVSRFYVILRAHFLAKSVLLGTKHTALLIYLCVSVCLCVSSCFSVCRCLYLWPSICVSLFLIFLGSLCLRLWRLAG